LLKETVFGPLTQGRAGHNKTLRLVKDDGELIPTRKSLLSRLKNWSDHEGWKLFFDTYWKLIYHAAITAGLTDAEAQDVVQETLIAVSNRISTFHYDAKRGLFKGWLLRLTSWRIADQFRKRQRGVQHSGQNFDTSIRKPRTSTDSSTTSTQAPTVERVVDPFGSELERTWDEEWEKNLKDAAIARVKRKVDAKQYQVFDLYVVKSLPVSRVTRLLRVNPCSVYVAKYRISNLIKKEIAYLRTKLI